MRDELNDLIKEELNEFKELVNKAIENGEAIGYPLPPLVDSIPTKGLSRELLTILTVSDNLDNLLKSYVSNYVKVANKVEDYIGFICEGSFIVGYDDESQLCLTINLERGEFAFLNIKEEELKRSIFDLDQFDRFNKKIHAFIENNQKLSQNGEWETLPLFDNKQWQGVYLRNKNRLKGSNLNTFKTYTP